MDNSNTPKSPNGTLARRIAEAEAKQATLAEKIRQMKTRRQQIEARQRLLESKRRRSDENQRKFEVGGLAALAGLLYADKGQLLGGLLMVADRLNNSPDWAKQVKARGDALLADREQTRKVKVNKIQRTAQEQTGLCNPESTPKEGQA